MVSTHRGTMSGAKLDASTYGEVTPDGARALFRAMGLCDTEDAACEPFAVFCDLGSGTGRMVAQAWLELPVAHAIGVELAPSRHAAAVRAWDSLSASGSALLTPGGAPPEFRQESMLQTDLSNATHIYIASLCEARAHTQRTQLLLRSHCAFRATLSLSE